jgi:hypothetical protein
VWVCTGVVGVGGARRRMSYVYDNFRWRKEAAEYLTLPILEASKFTSRKMEVNYELSNITIFYNI